MTRRWNVDFHGDFVEEYEGLPEEAQDELLACVALLERFANMKELRFAAADGVWRFAFAFDLQRRAIVLCGGDKSGGSERRFYEQLVSRADGRFDAHVASLLMRKDHEQQRKPRR